MKSFADSRLSVQFDGIDLAERGCAALAEAARRAGADAVQIERCDFYLDGDARKRALERASTPPTLRHTSRDARRPGGPQ